MKKLRTWLGKFLGYGITALLLFGVFSLVALFGGAIMHFFGFTYQSVGSIILFFIITGLAGFPCELVARALPMALLHMGKISQTAARVVFFILDMTVTVFFMLLVDYFMDSVSATDLSVIVIACIMALCSVKDIKERPQDQEAPSSSDKMDD